MGFRVEGLGFRFKGLGSTYLAGPAATKGLGNLLLKGYT